MRLASIRMDGRTIPALVEGERFLPLTESASVKAIIAGADPAGWVAGKRAAATDADWKLLAGATFDLPIADPGKIICIGLNYRDHAAEGGNPIPDYPALFMRTRISLVGAGQPIVRPQASERYDYEAELAIVIGKTCRHLSEDQALDAVFGYTLFNDGSVRDYQRKAPQWTAGKNFDASGSVGPAIVSKDELPVGASGLKIMSRVNGALLQNGNTGDMIFPVARAVSIISEVMTLEPGDLIATGTPAGVGYARKPPLWMKAGDVCEVEIEGIGCLVNPVVDEDMSKTRRLG